MNDRTITAMYDTRGAAETARDELINAGVPRDNITIRGAEGSEATTASGSGESRGFWGGLADLFMPDEDRYAYEEGIRRGGFLLTVQPPQGLESEVETILERHDPVDLDARATSWRESGWAGYETQASGSGAVGAAPAGTPYLAEGSDATSGRTAPTLAGSTGTSRDVGAATALASEGQDQDTLKVVEEQLRVGKREVGRGSVRVRSYVTERPVEEQVELRQERVTVERRPVDRELAPGEAAAAFQDRTIEAVERGEEAVVSKTAHVVEEVGVRKDVERETETIRDTVRRQDVEVEDDRTVTGAGRRVTDEDNVTDADRTVETDRTRPIG